jgi:hypothetical protein
VGIYKVHVIAALIERAPPALDPIADHRHLLLHEGRRAAPDRHHAERARWTEPLSEHLHAPATFQKAHRQQQNGSKQAENAFEGNAQ